MGAVKTIPASVWNFIRYDRETGKFFWIVDRRGPRRSGDEAGSVNRHGYIKIKIDQQVLLAHRLAWFAVHGTQPATIDHINGDPADNRIENLRGCTQGQNAKNREAVGASYYARLDKWVARITVERKSFNLGSYRTKEEAVRVAQEARVACFGEFARVV